MTTASAMAASAMSCTWLVCESGDRWRRAAERFAPAILPSGYECLPASPGEVRARAVHAPLLVVLYELPTAQPRETLRSIALCAARRDGPLQLVALEPHFPRVAGAEAQLAAHIRSLGAAAVLRHPEQLPLVGRLVTRYAARAYGSMDAVVTL